ncbi:MAG: TonB-dependent receptor [Bacteroidetes bacterium]|nr:TonB-dependent receptor [Bacteroidota bacterium]MBT3749046.1 TonB-dependent receptor [Bacteroidota bacterium]MBT4401487.1 TonB-dependent receptor [Bacteroidota bacterium]MBT4411173.1 TonB-dependent receptor [Bacteroidota bacterium]MBT7091821.1 TonB-dependent receptor [Bacteroidota bacterium]
MKLRIIALSLLIGSVIPAGLLGQEGLNKEVRVVKPYTPTISDAFKMRFVPRLDDTVQVEARFTYYIQPIMEPVEFRVRNLESIPLRAERVKELKHSYVRFGFGNYWTPMGELDINTTRNQKSSMGIRMGHLSSQGRINMPDDRKVYAGYADNDVKLYGSKFYNRSTLSGDIHFDEYHNFLYGYNTDTLTNGSLFTPYNSRLTTKDSIPLQQYLVVGGKFRLKSDERGRKGFWYQLDGGYDFLLDGQKEMEHNGNLDFVFSQEYKKWSFGGDVGVDYAYRLRPADSIHYVIANADPWLGFKWNYISLKAGPKVAMDRNASEFFFYPQVHMEINITNLVVPYIGLNGYYENNNYLKISKENPFVADDLDILPTNHRFIAYGGLRGRFLPRVAFDLYVSWEDVDNWHFYVPDTANAMRNRYSVEYDSGSLLSMGGEISLRQSERLSIILKGNYYRYTLDSLPAPWHKPNWDATVTTRYAFDDKLMLQADLYLLGMQEVPSIDVAKYGQTQKLDGLVDINLRAEYQATERISVFARVNNLISDNYYVWQNYPIQGINFLLGMGWTF